MASLHYEYFTAVTSLTKVQILLEKFSDSRGRKTSHDKFDGWDTLAHQSKTFDSQRKSVFCAHDYLPVYVFPTVHPECYVQKTTNPHRPVPLLNSVTVHSWLVRCSPPPWILKRMHAYPVGIFPLFLRFSFFPFCLASPCPPPPLSHWSSLTEKVWNRLRVGPQNKEAWQRFKSVWSYSRMGLCLHWASRRGKPAGNNPQLKSLCSFSSQSSN